MSHSHLFRSFSAMALTLSILLLAGCFFGEERKSPSDSTVDTTPPEVVDHYPEIGDTDVERNTAIWVEFSESMDEESVTSGLSVHPLFGYLTSWNGSVLDITLTDLLDASTIYSITIDRMSEDENGNELGFDYMITFMTGSGGDVDAPTILGTVPTSDEVDVPPLQPIEVRFSEPMDLASTENAIDIDPWPGITYIDWQGMTMEIMHGILPQDSLITVTIQSSATDLSGNNLAAPYTWSFRTVLDNERPFLLSEDPENGATDVLTGLNTVVLTFSEPMNPDFQLPVSDIDARFEQAMGEMDDPWNEDLTTATLELQNKLLPGCTYWIRFGGGVTDLAGNIIDPDPTEYGFTMTGDISYFPVQNNYLWRYNHSEEARVVRRIENFSGGTETFDIVTEEETSPGVWRTYEIWHMDRNTTEILHLGRDDYEDGSLDASMTWNDPIVYLKLPVGDHAGTSWNFETFAAMDPASGMDSLYITGTVEIEEFPTSLTADYESLHGTFSGCYIHHLIGNLEFYLEGELVGTESFHEKTWLSPGVGPVRIVGNPGDTDTLYVYDWEL